MVPMTMKLAPSAVRSGLCGAQWALHCNPWSSREASRGFHNLRHQVQVAIPGGRKRTDGEDLADFDPDDFRGFLGCSLPLRLSLAAPNDERASDPQERCRVFDHNVKRSQSPGGDEVHRRRPLLDSGVDDLDVAQL